MNAIKAEYIKYDIRMEMRVRLSRAVGIRLRSAGRIARKSSGKQEEEIC